MTLLTGRHSEKGGGGGGKLHGRLFMRIIHDIVHNSKRFPRWLVSSLWVPPLASIPLTFLSPASRLPLPSFSPPPSLISFPPNTEYDLQEESLKWNNTGLVFLYSYDWKLQIWTYNTMYAGALNMTNMRGAKFDYKEKFGGLVALSGKAQSFNHYLLLLFEFHV